MKKLAMDVETLSVESFEIGAGEPMQRGTVQGQQVATRDTSCDRTRCCPRTNLC
ncbi:hypothetical protein [Longimicrobium sp.]|uniref:hypothetical protein n=1 Tax=Longimicrobium sp. TaxID=2029185 RepID=UPI003B3A7472